MTGDIPQPFNTNNTGDPTQGEIDVLNGEFARLRPDWRMRAPKDILDSAIMRNLAPFIMRRYCGE